MFKSLLLAVALAGAAAADRLADEIAAQGGVEPVPVDSLPPALTRRSDSPSCSSDNGQVWDFTSQSHGATIENGVVARVGGTVRKTLLAAAGTERFGLFFPEDEVIMRFDRPMDQVNVKVYDAEVNGFIVTAVDCSGNTVDISTFRQPFGRPSYNTLTVTAPQICSVRMSQINRAGRGLDLTGVSEVTAFCSVCEGAGKFAVVTSMESSEGAAAACSAEGMTLAHPYAADWMDVGSTVFNCVGANKRAWIDGYNGDSYAGTCVAFQSAPVAGGGSLNVPPEGCAEFSLPVVCAKPETPAVEIPHRRRK